MRSAPSSAVGAWILGVALVSVGRPGAAAPPPGRARGKPRPSPPSVPSPPVSPSFTDPHVTAPSPAARATPLSAAPSVAAGSAGAVAPAAATSDAPCWPADLAFHESAGIDAQWGTPDDVGNQRLAITEDGARTLWRPPFATSQRNPLREVEAEVFAPERDRAGHLVRETLLHGPGLDGQWGTDDDLPELVFSFELDDRGRPVREVARTPPPAPGFSYAYRAVPDTLAWYDYRRDERGRLVELRFVAAAGPDGQWFTDDDIVASRIVFEYDERGRSTRRLGYGLPGPDGQWGTADDVLSERVFDQWDGSGAWTGLRIERSAGFDNQWGTQDDPEQRVVATGDRRCTTPAERLLVVLAPFSGPLRTPALVKGVRTRPVPR